MRLRSLQISALWLTLAAGPVSALDLSEHTSTFFLNGFGTLGGVYNTSDQASFIRDKAQPDGPRDDGISWETDSRIGIQGRWKPRDDFEATLQIVSKYRYDGSYRPTVTWGFLKYAFTPDLELRVGRLGFDIYFNAESSDVGYSYLWLRPPGEFYTPIYYTHYDGADLTLSHPIGDGVLKGKLFAGKTDESIASSTDADYQLLGEMWGGVLKYQLPKWLFCVGFDVSRLYEDYESTSPLLGALRRTGVPQAISLADDLRLSQGDYVYLAAGIAYEDGPWRANLGLSHIDTDNLVFPGSLATSLSLGYRINRWTPYVTYSRVKSEHPKADSGLPDFYPYSLVDQYVDRAIAYNQFDQDTFAVGARYDFAKNAALKMQVDWSHSRDNPSIFWVDTDPDWDGRATLFSLSLDFIF
jgi:hypothetical protein